MGACPCRARSDAEESEEEQESEEAQESPEEDSLDRWSRVVRLGHRLAFRRRLWAFLGHWLLQIKERGRASLVSQ